VRSLIDSIGRGSDGDFCSLLYQETSTGETYPQRAAGTGDERNSPGEVHLFSSLVSELRQE
jgi:hypothetical protein